MARHVPPNPEAFEEIHTSAVLHRLVREAPADFFTLDWFVGHLPKRSFGVILLFLALISVLPVISIPARLLIVALTFQAIIGYQAPVLPRRWMKRRLPTRYLRRLERFVIPVLKHLEVIVRPRWCRLLTGTRHLAAFTAMLLTVLSLLAPFPLANVPPSIICIFMALAFIEHDGLLLAFAFAAALALLGAVGAVLWI